MMRIASKAEDHTRRIGCSQLGAIKGVSKFATPYDVYLAYWGKEAEKPEPTDEQKESMAMGTFFEDAICRYFAKKYSLKIRRSNLGFCRDDMPYFICHPDRLVTGTVDGKRLALECKLVSQFSSDWGDEDTDQIPDSYLLQCQGYFACGVPCDEVWLCRMQGNRVKRFVIAPDQELIKMILDSVKEFHDKLEDGWIPDPSTQAEANSRWVPTENCIKADSSVKADLTLRANIKSQEKALRIKLDEVELRIKNYMGDFGYITDFGKDGKPVVLATWKNQPQNRFDQSAFRGDHPDLYGKYIKTGTSRVLRQKGVI
jgi:predicted phage-related endonuclease